MPQQLPGACVLHAIAVLATAGLVTYCALVPGAWMPYHQLIDAYYDLLAHVAAFGALTLVVLAGSRRTRPAIACLAGLAVVLEGAQIFIPRRTASLEDLAASLLGILLAWLLVGVVKAIMARFVGRGAEPIASQGPG